MSAEAVHDDGSGDDATYCPGSAGTDRLEQRRWHSVPYGPCANVLCPMGVGCAASAEEALVCTCNPAISKHTVYHPDCLVGLPCEHTRFLDEKRQPAPTREAMGFPELETALGLGKQLKVKDALAYGRSLSKSDYKSNWDVPANQSKSDLKWRTVPSRPETRRGMGLQLLPATAVLCSVCYNQFKNALARPKGVAGERLRTNAKAIMHTYLDLFLDLIDTRVLMGFVALFTLLAVLGKTAAGLPRRQRTVWFLTQDGPQPHSSSHVQMRTTEMLSVFSAFVLLVTALCDHEFAAEGMRALVTSAAMEYDVPFWAAVGDAFQDKLRSLATARASQIRRKLLTPATNWAVDWLGLPADIKVFLLAALLPDRAHDRTERVRSRAAKCIFTYVHFDKIDKNIASVSRVHDAASMTGVLANSTCNKGHEMLT